MDNSEKPAYLTDYWTTQDHLRFSDFRPALLSILTQAQTPLTVGVFGPWGSGKTSLLRMLKQEIDDKNLPSLRTVWFTAWKYDRHEALWRAFILRVLDSLYPREPGDGPRETWERIPFDRLGDEQKEQVKRLDRLARSLYGTVEWEELGRWVMEWDKAGKEMAKLPAFLLLLSIGGEKVAKELGIAPDLADLVQREAQAHRMEQLASMEQFETTFQEAIGGLIGRDGRLIIFVDDLDRCLPEKAVEVLEAIKLFLEVPGTVFVLGMDREVIERGIEARYVSFFRSEQAERAELPIRGDVYLQKIVQIPFHLPLLAVDDLDKFIRDLDASRSLSAMTRAVFSHGLYPNPRQVKRTLNIFRLLREIAETSRLDDVSWPLLAKTVLIQTQWPELYRDWRQYPTLVQTLEAEYVRRPIREEEMLHGRPLPTSEEAKAEERAKGGLLEPYLAERRKYALLERMLAFPEQAQQDGETTRFEGLSRERMAVYTRLAGAVEPEATVVEVPGDLATDLFSGDRARIEDGLARLAEQEPEQDGSLRSELREQLQAAMRAPDRPAQERAGAGFALARLGDPRFRSDGWFLPDEPLLGFVEIPPGEFLMGSDKQQDDMARDNEQPQHSVMLLAYYIARYPVTVAQFRAFVEASGYKPENDDSLKGVDTHPVVRVSWHEALKYCQWLTERLRESASQRMGELANEGQRRFWEGLAGGSLAVTLPSEAQWEKAARGGLQIPVVGAGLAPAHLAPAPGRPQGGRPQGSPLRENPNPARIYPWGNDPDPNRANYGETGIGTTSAVGCFPGGASPYGVEDLSGNVWEWCCTKWEDSYENYQGDNDVEGSARRVLRGGSFASNLRRVRCACRNWNTPLDRDRNYGFRVVVASPSALYSEPSEL